MIPHFYDGIYLANWRAKDNLLASKEQPTGATADSWLFAFGSYQKVEVGMPKYSSLFTFLS